MLRKAAVRSCAWPMLTISGVLMALAGCRSNAATPPAAPVPTTAIAGSPNAAEARYARDTGLAIYRSRAIERTRSFVFADSSRGYGLCLRAPMRNGGFDHTLLVLQRRITQGAVSQVEDDAVILRRAADVATCRNRSDWIAAR